MDWASLSDAEVLAAVRMAGLGLFAEGLRRGVSGGNGIQDFTAGHHRNLLTAALTNPACRWQRWIDGDVYCSASAPGDPDLLSADGPAYLAPTTGHTCLSCNMPKDPLRCSALTHPSVKTVDQGEPRQRALIAAQCSKGMPEVSNPGQCQPGGHPCWRFVVHVAGAADPAPIPDLGPLSLPEALDRFNAAWRTRFGIGLLKELPVMLASRLDAPVDDLDGFVSRINALVTVLEFRIENDLIPREARGLGGVKKLRAAMEQAGLEVPEGPFQDLGAAIACRTAGEHVHKSDQLTSALEYFGLPSITNNPGEAWRAISQRCAHALAELADLVGRDA